MVVEAKKSYPYSHYNEIIPLDHKLRVVKTPEPDELLRGDEWDLMFKNWIKDIGQLFKREDFKNYQRFQNQVGC